MAIPRYPRRSYHPSQEGSPRKAVAYLAQSPAARPRRARWGGRHRLVLALARGYWARWDD